MGICYGRTDLDVAETFERDAQAVIKNLSRPDFIISSPLQRCRKLAERIGHAFDLPMRLDVRLTEMDFGAWEGLAWDNVPRTELDLWAADFMHAKPHGGESVAMLNDRVMEAYAHYSAAPRASYLWVCHAGVIKAALSRGDTAEDYNTSVDFGDIITISEFEIK